MAQSVREFTEMALEWHFSGVEPVRGDREIFDAFLPEEQRPTADRACEAAFAGR